MSSIIGALGVLCVMIFAAAGYKTLAKMRTKQMTRDITYQQRTDLMVSKLTSSFGLTPSALVHRAIIAKSTANRSHA